MIQQRDSAPQPPITHVVLVQNWLEELKRLVPDELERRRRPAVVVSGPISR